MSDRIDGWKAIGGYFGRDRSTAIRWANDRGLPVRRMPGGKRASVYALKSDLDSWMKGQDGLDEGAPEPPLEETIQTPAAPRPSRRGLILTGAGLTVTAMTAGGVYIFTRPGGEGAPARDPAVAEAYLKARENWAMRTPASLDRARILLEDITRREPDFAQAHAALADVYLLMREFGQMDDARAFQRARLAAEAALKQDPNLADAHRAQGFVRYWGDGDPAKAGRSFRRALALAPQVAQTHFWYGNILADNGEHEPAMRELNAARRIEPGSVAIQVDHAWALWSAGQTREAARQLDALAQERPDFSVIFDCLSLLRLERGDLAGYADALGRFASLSKDAGDASEAAGLKAALGQGEAAAWAFLFDKAFADAQGGKLGEHVWPAFVAVTARDGRRLATVLRAADQRHEGWGRAGMVRRIRDFARTDPALARLVDARRRDRVE